MVSVLPDFLTLLLLFSSRMVEYLIFLVILATITLTFSRFDHIKVLAGKIKGNQILITTNHIFTGGVYIIAGRIGGSFGIVIPE